MKSNTFFRGVMMTLCILLISIMPLTAQNIRVTGTVIDDAGAPMIGAGVMEKGTTNGVVTDIEGKFTISVPQGAVLVFSSVSFVTQELPAEQGMTVIMTEDKELLEEVVVIGYGTVRAKNFTGSVDVLRMDDTPVSDMGLSNVADLLRNRMSGVVLGAESASAGSRSSMLVRGRKSINSTSTEPLVILDGVIFAGDLDDIDPNSIESISVLKDATSLAAYGSKAAQGAIMITSKRGHLGKPIFNFSTSHEFQTPSYTPKYADGEHYIRYRNAKVGNEDLTDTSWMSFIEKENYAKGKTTDWFDLATRTGYYQTYNMNMSGATENLNYYIGAGHRDMQGMAVGNDVTRTTLSANISAKVFHFLQVGMNFNYTTTKNSGVSASVGSAYQTPYGEAYLPDGRWRLYVDGEDNTATNPVFSSYVGRERESHRKNLTLGGFVSLDIPWVKGLNLRINASFNETDSRNKNFTYEDNRPAMLANDWEGKGYSEEYYSLANASGSSSHSYYKNWVIDNILSYARGFGDHYVSASLVYTRDSAEQVSESYEGSDFTSAGNTILGWYALGNSASKDFSSPSYSLHTDVGYLARAMYSFRDTYHFNVSFRRDGSSVFGADNKWGNFPAVGGAWTISNEKFMKKADWLNNLKLKLSWGKNGAQTISPYGTLSTIALAKGGGIANYYDGTIHWGQKISALGNPTLGWQTTTSWNTGFESDAFNRRLHLELNYYYSKTTDQIFNRSIPIMTAGIANQKATMGRVDNQGIELNMNSVNIKRRNFTWNTGVVLTLNRNKLIDLYGDGKDDIANKLFLGESLGVVYDYQVGGIYQTGDADGTPGTPYFINKDGDRVATPTADDRKILGTRDENFRMSLSNTFTYKNLSLYVMFNGVFGGNGYALANNTFAYQTFAVQNRISCLDIPFWTVDNPSDKYPAANYKNSQSHYQVYNSFAFVRLQDVSLSYNITPLVERFKIKNARIALTGRNLFFIAPKWLRSDPESRSASSYGLPRSVTVSLNVSF